jgi:HD-GYP domain-containing protein (c-di-GMP phosphodiesterase class II)
MTLKKYGLIHQANGNSIESINIGGLQVSLLSSFDSTEIIHHSLSANDRWAIGPAEGWEALEFIYVLSGELKGMIDHESITLKKGDSLQAISITEDCYFKAVVDTEFLYVVSKPVFYLYSDKVNKMRDLAISVEEKDGYTAGHCNRIMQLSMKLGEMLNLSPHELHQINLGSFLHDIGKVKVPDHILNKPSKLSPEEWAIMKMHPIYGKEILEEMNLPYLMEASDIIGQHHERYDGTGYPLGLKENEICIGAAIVAIVDSYDAMTYDRVYRKALSKEEAMQEIVQGRGTLYQPDVVDAFLSIISEIGDFIKNEPHKD